MWKSILKVRKAYPLGLLLLMSACASTDPAFLSVTPTTQPVTNDSTYVIGPGDGLSVFVWQNPDLSTDVTVRPDGRLSIPLVDDMQAVGKTPSQLALDIETVLADFIRTPDVTIIVSNFGVGAFGNQIRVLGAGAEQPQVIPYRQGLTLLDVMVEVGLSDFAAGDRSKLVRRVEGELIETAVRLDRLINRGDLTENLVLMPGDVLIIPESRF